MSQDRRTTEDGASKQPPGGAPRLWHRRAAVINALAFVLNVAVVGASSVGLLGRTQKGVSDTFTTLITPAAFAFGIWGPIYSGESAWVVWALQKGNERARSVAAVGPWFSIACALQAVWSVAWAQEALLTSTAILSVVSACLWASAAGLRRARAAGDAPPPNGIEFRSSHFTIALHAGWVLAATLVNVNMALVGAGAMAALQLWAAAASLLALGAAGTAYGVKRRDLGFGAAIAWALLGAAANPGARNGRLSVGAARGLQGVLTAGGVALAAVLARAVRRSAGARRDARRE
ncbi:hypothetical protein JKP88DRAFT_316596 [Tribonema minus]|uniref:Tryptophan-rich sensory protein n=1 Tax=Tribonema minus TaxID=303371 RepID=A0A835YY35_9STRA|nr:hypothetical protein JKP88DRAFT_316596 [Tribonema minus]